MNLFVYGTLRAPYNNPMAQLLRQNARLLGHGSIRGRLFDLGWYPGAVYEPDSPHRVWGDVYALTDDDILIQLDEYEGINHHPDDEYARREVLVQLIEGQNTSRTVVCQMYVFQHADGQPKWIESGNYLTR